MSQISPSVPGMSPGSDVDLDVVGFFGALSVADPAKREEAKRFLKVAFENDEAGEEHPSPRAREFVVFGEWEVRDVALLKLTDEVLKKTCKSEIGVPRAGDAPRFCANRSLDSDGSCAISAHKVGNALKDFAPGFYISTTDKPFPTRTGVWLKPRCPVGPPFNERVVEDAILDPQTPFCLSPGQWKFVFAEVQVWRRLHGLQALLLEEPGGPGPVSVSDEPESHPAQGATVNLKAEAQNLEEGHPPKELHVDTGLDPVVHHVLDVAPPQVPNRGEESAQPTSDEALWGRIRSLETAHQADSNIIQELSLKLQAVEKQNTQASQLTATQVRALVQQEVGLAVDRLPTAHQEVASLKTHMGTLDQTQSLRTTSVMQELEQLRESVLGDNGVASALKRDIRSLTDEVEHGGVAYRRHIFASPTDFLNWMSLEMPTRQPDYGLFVDIFSLLHTLTPGTVTHSEALKTEHDQAKVNYKSSLQSKVSTSYDTCFPDVFGRADASGQHFGKAMDTHDKWYDPDMTQGLSFTIDVAMEAQYAAMVEQIDRELYGTELRVLAIDMLNDSKRFFGELLRFLEESFSSMRAGGGLPDAEAWEITKSCFEQILTDVHISRGVVKYTRVDTPLLHIWGVLKAHEVMIRYQKFRFKDDPALTGIILRFILKHQKESSVSKLNTKITGQDNLIAKCNQTVNRIEREVKALKDNKKGGSA